MLPPPLKNRSIETCPPWILIKRIRRGPWCRRAILPVPSRRFPWPVNYPNPGSRDGIPSRKPPIRNRNRKLAPRPLLSPRVTAVGTPLMSRLRLTKIQLPLPAMMHREINLPNQRTGKGSTPCEIPMGRPDFRRRRAGAAPALESRDGLRRADPFVVHAANLPHRRRCRLPTF